MPDLWPIELCYSWGIGEKCAQKCFRGKELIKNAIALGLLWSLPANCLCYTPLRLSKVKLYSPLLQYIPPSHTGKNYVCVCVLKQMDEKHSLSGILISINTCFLWHFFLITFPFQWCTKIEKTRKAKRCYIVVCICNLWVALKIRQNGAYERERKRPLPWLYCTFQLPHLCLSLRWLRRLLLLYAAAFNSHGQLLICLAGRNFLPSIFPQKIVWWGLNCWWGAND